MANQREIFIENAKKYAGKPYVWGGESMEEGGYDCSGYMYNIFNDSGIRVGRTTADGYRKLGKKIPTGKQKPGDLLFFGKNDKATHIAMYAGDGKMWESIGGSANTKNNPGKGVTLSNISRRRDLFEVRTLIDNASETYEPVKQNVPRSWLQKGDEGQKVIDMQIMLIEIDYSCGKSGADGKFGLGTENAVLKFQKNNGLIADGLYGEKSKAKLESIYKTKTNANNHNYIIGKTYTLQAEMKVRAGAGTQYSAKLYSQLTVDGRKHDADGDGALDKGTIVTCKEVKRIGNDIWVRTPSGWIAAVYNGKVYIS